MRHTRLHTVLKHSSTQAYIRLNPLPPPHTHIIHAFLAYGHVHLLNAEARDETRAYFRVRVHVAVVRPTVEISHILAGIVLATTQVSGYERLHQPGYCNVETKFFTAGRGH